MWGQRLTPRPEERMERGLWKIKEGLPTLDPDGCAACACDVTISFASELRHGFYRVLQEVDFDEIGEKVNKKCSCSQQQ